MIEALTYLTYLGICKGEVLLSNVNVGHLEYTLDILAAMGYKFKSGNDNVLATVDSVPLGCDVVTAPYPYFPTDLHPQFASLLCFSKKGGIIKESIYPTRFQYVAELKKMGALIDRIDDSVCIQSSKIHAAVLNVPDLRAGASIIGCALGAEGISVINNVKYIVRGYEDIVSKLTSVGGKIKITKGE